MREHLKALLVIAIVLSGITLMFSMHDTGTNLSIWAQIVSASAATVSAYFWLLSAFINIPRHGADSGWTTPEATRAKKRLSEANATAAAFAAFSAFGQAASILFQAKHW